MPDPIPVTLLTGFLGAGKTTLPNRLLHDPAAGRVAVFENEFGEAGLDHDLIGEAAEAVDLMPAGCICCSIRDDLAGRAHATDGPVPFHFPDVPDCGQTSGANPDERRAGARVEAALGKHDPRDVVPWKPSAPGHPGWNCAGGRAGHDPVPPPRRTP